MGRVNLLDNMASRSRVTWYFFPTSSSVQTRPSTKPKRSFKISCSRLLKWPRAFST